MRVSKDTHIQVTESWSGGKSHLLKWVPWRCDYFPESSPVIRMVADLGIFKRFNIRSIIGYLCRES